jgi:hypothetical protein
MKGRARPKTKTSPPAVIEVRLPSIRFHSPGDEASLFAWMARIPSIIRVHGVGRDLVLTISRARLDADDMRELLGVLTRYGCPLRVLRPLVKPAFRAWIRNPAAYWFGDLFGVARGGERL